MGDSWIPWSTSLGTLRGRIIPAQNFRQPLPPTGGMQHVQIFSAPRSKCYLPELFWTSVFPPSVKRHIASAKWQNRVQFYVIQYKIPHVLKMDIMCWNNAEILKYCGDKITLRKNVCVLFSENKVLTLELNALLNHVSTLYLAYVLSFFNCFQQYQCNFCWHKCRYSFWQTDNHPKFKLQ